MLVLTLGLLFSSIGLKKHALTVLLTLEIISLIIIIIIIYYGVEVFFTIVMVCVRACEGAVGLSALIRSSRSLSISHYA